MQQQEKNIYFAEANAMNISAKFQLYPQYSFWILFSFSKLTNQTESLEPK